MTKPNIIAQWVCDTCGSPKVQVQVWFDPNTEEPIDDTGGDAWCEACDNNCVVTTKPLEIKIAKGKPQ
jgi:hypothetical protein